MDHHRCRPRTEELGGRLGHQVQGWLQLTRGGQRSTDATERLGLLQGPPQGGGLVLHLTLEPLRVLRHLLTSALGFEREGTLAEDPIHHHRQCALEPDLLDDVVRGALLEGRDGHELVAHPRHQHDRRLVVRLAERAKELDAVATGQGVVGQDYRKRRLSYRREGCLGITNDLDGHGAPQGRRLAEGALDELPVGGTVLDEQQSKALVGPTRCTPPYEHASYPELLSTGRHRGDGGRAHRPEDAEIESCDRLFPRGFPIHQTLSARYAIRLSPLRWPKAPCDPASGRGPRI